MTPDARQHTNPHETLAGLCRIPHKRDDPMRRTICLLAILTACGTSAANGPDRYGAPPDAEPVTIDGVTLYLTDIAVYGPCELLAPHNGNFAGWLNRTPAQPYEDFGFVCTD